MGVECQSGRLTFKRTVSTHQIRPTSKDIEHPYLRCIPQRHLKLENWRAITWVWDPCYKIRKVPEWKTTTSCYEFVLSYHCIAVLECLELMNVFIIRRNWQYKDFSSLKDSHRYIFIENRTYPRVCKYCKVPTLTDIHRWNLWNRADCKIQI